MNMNINVTFTDGSDDQIFRGVNGNLSDVDHGVVKIVMGQTEEDLHIVMIPLHRVKDVSFMVDVE
jgi:hypothetical protein